jgi:hypothetical protein
MWDLRATVSDATMYQIKETLWSPTTTTLTVADSVGNVAAQLFNGATVCLVCRSFCLRCFSKQTFRDARVCAWCAREVHWIEIDTSERLGEH